MDVGEAGRIAYEAYAEARGNTAYDGSSLHSWIDLEEGVRAAWATAAISGAAYVAGEVFKELAGKAQGA